MNEPELHRLVVLAIVGAAVPTLGYLLWSSAPYGRHARGGWGPTVPPRWGWILMESPAVLVFAAVFAAGQHAASAVPVAMFVTWQVHYVYRTFVFPFRIKSARPMPLLVAVSGLGFNVANAYANARWISELGSYTHAWLLDPRYLLGTLVFLLGWAMNHRADAVLLSLRGPGESGYRVPQGGMYRWVSCPNYLGEVLEWTGWALLTWSTAGAAFALFTVANLLPRALAHHRWYRAQFPAYPAERRAIIPFLL